MASPGFIIQDTPDIPAIYVVGLDGPWLLKRVTPSWRIDDPHEGFQRMVDERRARKIATNVLDKGRTFPNAIVLATDEDAVSNNSDGTLTIDSRSKFVVIDGQHRLWAQHFSKQSATYPCVIHTRLSEEDMASLFVEINNNQKRVPSSLRWDLTRLVRSDEDPDAARASDILYVLSTDDESPVQGHIDLTGEIKKLSLKQGSISPEIKSAIKKPPLSEDYGFEIQYHVFNQFFTAVRDYDPDGWAESNSPFYANRVLRALIKTIPKILQRKNINPKEVTADIFLDFYEKIEPESLDRNTIKTQQGTAGIAEITNTIENQIF